MTREEQILNGFTEMMKGFWGNQDLEVPNIETPCKQEPCEDCISRQAVLKQLKSCLTGGETEYNYVKLHIDSIPHVTPQPNTGRWIDLRFGQECSRCHEIQYGDDDHRFYCPNCGAKMERSNNE